MEHRGGRLENSKRFNAALLVEKSALEELYFILGITYRHTKCLFTLYIQIDVVKEVAGMAGEEKLFWPNGYTSSVTDS